MLKKIHHIDYVVRDLDRAVETFRRVSGIEPHGREHLAERGIDLARFLIGETWIILVQPVSPDSPVQAFLDRHGEGFFHIAYEVDDVERAAAEVRDRGIRPVNEVPRRGVEGWKLVDLEIEDTLGVMTQLVEPERD